MHPFDSHRWRCHGTVSRLVVVTERQQRRAVDAALRRPGQDLAAPGGSRVARPRPSWLRSSGSRNFLRSGQRVPAPKPCSPIWAEPASSSRTRWTRAGCFTRPFRSFMAIHPRLRAWPRTAIAWSSCSRIQTRRRPESGSCSRASLGTFSTSVDRRPPTMFPRSRHGLRLTATESESGGRRPAIRRAGRSW